MCVCTLHHRWWYNSNDYYVFRMLLSLERMVKLMSMKVLLSFENTCCLKIRNDVTNQCFDLYTENRMPRIIWSESRLPPISFNCTTGQYFCWIKHGILCVFVFSLWSSRKLQNICSNFDFYTFKNALKFIEMEHSV